MTYLTYIIDHYDNLADRNLFLHGHESSWHQTANISKIIHDLNWDYNGYININCHFQSGKHCGADLHPKPRRSNTAKWNNDNVFADTWDKLMKPHGFRSLPSSVATPCCAQFLVSKQAILKNSKEFYNDARNLIRYTEHNDDNIGVTMEYLWHIIFTHKNKYCPSYKDCYCTAYNKCGKLDINQQLAIDRPASR